MPLRLPAAVCFHRVSESPQMKARPKHTGPVSQKRTRTANARGLPASLNDSPATSASQQIGTRIAELGDWRGEVLRRVRTLIKEADPAIIEEWKWNVPVWSHNGIVCTGEAYKSIVKLTFVKGASLCDPAALFNASLEGRVRRAIDIREDEQINEAAFRALIRSAVALNQSSAKKQLT